MAQLPGRLVDAVNKVRDPAKAADLQGGASHTMFRPSGSATAPGATTPVAAAGMSTGTMLLIGGGVLAAVAGAVWFMRRGVRANPSEYAASGLRLPAREPGLDDDPFDYATPAELEEYGEGDEPQFGEEELGDIWEG